MRPLFFFSESFLHYDMGPQHPMKPRRLQLTKNLLDVYGMFDSALELINPASASPFEVAETHSEKFVDFVHEINDGSQPRNAQIFGFGSGDNPIFPGIFDSSLLYTGASLDAAQAVMDGSQIAINIAGGLHHAHYAKAAGFCVFNDCAVAINRLRRKYQRAAYVDIDVHHGDGVQELFYKDPSVLTISLHQSGKTLFPGTGDTSEIGEGPGEGFCVNLPFDPYTTDEIWLKAWRNSALPILQAFKPEVILLQMGSDAHCFDPLANLCLSAQGWLEAVQDIKAIGVPIVAVGGGGYNMTTVPRMWTLAIAELGGISLADTVPESYLDKERVPSLTDHEAFKIHPEDLSLATAFADQSVQQLKRLLFPKFGLA